MKSTLLINLAVPCVLAAAALAQAPVLPGGAAAKTAEEVGILPEQKRATADASRLEPETRNPFVTLTDPTPGPSKKDTQSEEARIRNVLEKFLVNGIAKGPDGKFTGQMQGGIILKEGELLPRVIEGQVDDLRVTKINPKLVEITWVADEDADKPRKITMAVDMSPTIAVMLPSPDGRGELTTMRDKADVPES